MAQEFELGMMGLGTMGSNLALNMVDHGYGVAGYDVGPKAVASFNDKAEGRPLKGYGDLKEFLANLKTPRVVVMLIPAPVVDGAINDLMPLLEEGDILIDAGNSHFSDTDRRTAIVEAQKLHFVGMGVSGGEEGARLGPSMMPGGPKDSYERIRPIVEAVSAQVNGEACVAYMGAGSAGHYVKMVHNGIEYGIMQLIAETYDFMKNGLALSNDEIQAIFERWGKGSLDGFLTEITANIFTKKDPETQKAMVDVILDAAKQKGTGMWASQDAMALHVPIPTIDIAVSMRDLSVLKADRVKLSEKDSAPSPEKVNAADRDVLIEQLEHALSMSIMLTFAQGMSLIQAASKAYNYGINLSVVAKIWRGGCIIRSNMLEPISSAYAKNPDLTTLLLDEEFSRHLSTKHSDLQKIVIKAIQQNVPVSAFSASLAYYQAYHRASLPSNLIQAQRDYFGAHTYERNDKPGTFHTEWTPVTKEPTHVHA